ncbi:tRNA(Met) cytidine acetyltransferase [Salinivibrio sp. VYel9]|nr:tRNA(Met) cytidine acetyltransferase [Salinivibrio sp. VYel7]MPX89605.1 tRNA(Met) cytidine acetyltransferase [Salinivibrio sp. VYel1]MPX92255.1 tRNA(Met) cytidine acetyltransferase [Salinivibrio sp. VYel9]MPX97169.1 tRNA(Met) cytidine acetyltransferase [Salinivibrio sp. VYel6]MPX98487.1 tRNA(Met) cytidine acetyltransferase [Salinivibrio sp. VYel4]MPY01812.1 tRNA(Met) cytidine acetyltransferase [Salinivibrio sp. VYel5]MPY04728.1 tRNA(Met) cytidine acetyltransferase [Salinivibrio sp. VYel8]
MMTLPTLEDFFEPLILRAAHYSHRQLVCVDQDLATVLAGFGETQPPLLVGNTEYGLSWRQAHQKLGQECGHIVVEVNAQFNAEAFCAIVGCCRAGALIVLRIAALDNEMPPSVQRLLRCLSEDDSVAFNCHWLHRLPQQRPAKHQTHSVTQDDAIAAVEKVVTGHRRRPLLLTADRGRGKSAALGMAAANLMMKKPRRIIVSSPSPAHASTLFHHLKATLQIDDAGQHIDYQGSQIRFIAPDALLQDAPAADLLLVDEAAAIPLPIISQWLNQYSRVAIATTEHGYEGTGRAFTLRLKQMLDVEQPQWRTLKLTAPMRWADDDPVERTLNALFLLNGDDVGSDQTDMLETGWVNDMVIEPLSRQQLYRDEACLRQLFTLLIAAHYQTSPNDLARLLDDDAGLIFAGWLNNKLIAACVVSQEGGLDWQTCHAVVAGQRRIKGHLFSQSVAAHLGLAEVLHDRLWRVQRIAVSEPYRQQGVGQRLLATVNKHAAEASVVGVGVSFGATAVLTPFWFKQGFKPVKLGLKRDQASGCYSLQMLKPIQPLKWCDQALRLFRQNLPIQMLTSHQRMETDIAASIIAGLPTAPLSEEVRQQIDGFVAGGVGVDAALSSLQAWLYHHIGGVRKNDENATLPILVSRILLGLPWSVVCTRYLLAGKRDAESRIRNYIQTHMTT